MEKKKINIYLKRQNDEISHEKTDLATIEENESLVAAENDTIRTNYVKEKIDNTQQSSKCITRRNFR